MLLDAPLPDTWSKMGNADLDLVPVKSGTRDYERVTELFKQTYNQTTEILKVYMVIQLYKIVNTKVILRLACLHICCLPLRATSQHEVC